VKIAFFPTRSIFYCNIFSLIRWNPLPYSPLTPFFLCSVLSGQCVLEKFLFKIKRKLSPLCSCLSGDGKRCQSFHFCLFELCCPQREPYCMLIQSKSAVASPASCVRSTQSFVACSIKIPGWLGPDQRNLRRPSRPRSD
jgi:hypothetical protein